MATFLDAALAVDDSAPSESTAWVAARRAQVALALGDIPTCLACADRALGVARVTGETTSPAGAS